MKRKLIYALAIVAAGAMAVSCGRHNPGTQAVYTAVCTAVYTAESGDTMQVTGQIPAEFADLHLRLYKADISGETTGEVSACHFIVDRNTDLVVRPDGKPYHITCRDSLIIFHNSVTGETKSFAYPDRVASAADMENLVYRLKFATTRDGAYRDLVSIGEPSINWLMQLAKSTDTEIRPVEGTGDTAGMDTGNIDIRDVCWMAIREIMREIPARYEQQLSRREKFGNRQLTRQDELDICESVYRYQFVIAAAGWPGVNAYHLLMFDKDPPVGFLIRFIDNVPPVRQGSAFVEGKGLLFQIKSIAWLDSIASVKGCQTAGALSGAGYEYKVVRLDGNWVVIKNEMQWLS